ncbi:nuclease [Halobacteriales archaeon QS_4_70_19]|nr:MAG: nuclease [Halobacteriales archaeon QS_4_70_19]
MTLDPVHFKAITRLAGRVNREDAEQDHRDFADTVWNEYLDPLVTDEGAVLEPLGEQRRRRVHAEDIALAEDPFPTRHGLDSGTINPTTFKSGLVVDVAQAAMSAVPSDVDLHRGRTMVTAVHTHDATTTFEEDWRMDDEGYVRGRVLHVPRVDRSVTSVVHELALYLAEITHANRNREIVDDLLVLDGPVYPKGLLTWAERDPELQQLLSTEEQPQTIIERYVGMVEHFADRGVPLIGFVKTPVSRQVTRTIREKEGSAPWVNDAAFFSQVLTPDAYDTDGADRDTSSLTFTNWFVSRGGTDGALSAPSVPYDIQRERDPADYEVTFCMLYDPRTDTVYRVESPAVFTRDEELRERLTRHVLKSVATERGPPLAVRKADQLARISRQETVALREALERAFDSELDTNYGDERAAKWGLDG